jgi:hypothetical protein
MGTAVALKRQKGSRLTAIGSSVAKWHLALLLHAIKLKLYFPFIKVKVRSYIKPEGNTSGSGTSDERSRRAYYVPGGLLPVTLHAVC